jgi:hypothetical protein
MAILPPDNCSGPADSFSNYSEGGNPDNRNAGFLCSPAVRLRFVMDRQTYQPLSIMVVSLLHPCRDHRSGRISPISFIANGSYAHKPRKNCQKQTIGHQTEHHRASSSPTKENI